MLAFQKLLVPIDFSEASLHALRLAINVAKQETAALRLVHVGTLPYVDIGRFDATMPALLVQANDQMAQESRTALDRLAREEVPAGMGVSVEVRSGFPAEEIVLEAAACDADLIVMGTRGRTGVERLLLGSVAEGVIRAAPIPVLTTH